MVVKKSDGPAAAPRIGRAEGHQKARCAPDPAEHSAWLGWVILGALLIAAVALAVVAASLGGS